MEREIYPPLKGSMFEYAKLGDAFETRGGKRTVFLRIQFCNTNLTESGEPEWRPCYAILHTGEDEICVHLDGIEDEPWEGRGISNNDIIKRII